MLLKQDLNKSIIYVIIITGEFTHCLNAFPLPLIESKTQNNDFCGMPCSRLKHFIDWRN